MSRRDNQGGFWCHGFNTSETVAASVAVEVEITGVGNPSCWVTAAISMISGP